MGEGRTKRLRDNETSENSRKAPRMDEDNILAAGAEVDLGGAKADVLGNADLNTVKGMPNFGNTCYLNALLQCLLALGKLRKVILDPDANLGILGMALKDLFVMTSGRSYTEDQLMDPGLVTACIRAWDNKFKGTNMQDSQELFLSVLSRLGKEEKDEANNPSHLHGGISRAGITDLIFGGEICLRNSCSCTKVSSDYLHFDDLGLPVPTKAKNAGDFTKLDQFQQYKDRVQGNQVCSLALIEECLKLYFKEEMIPFCCSSTDNSENGEQIVTSSSKPVSASASCSTTPGYPETVQENFPNCLSAERQVTLLCAQDNQDEDLQSQERAEEARVNEGATRSVFITKLPEVLVLHLQRYSIQSEGSDAIKLSGHVSFQELLNVGQFMEPSCEDNNSIYHLAGVIEHIGTTPTSGHYVAYVKAKAGGWSRVSDDVTTQVSLHNVLQCEAYMLFYERG